MPGKNEPTAGVEPKDRAWICMLLVLILLPFTPLIVFSYFKGLTWVSGNWDKVLGVAFGLEGVVTFILADRASKKTDITLKRIQETEQLLAKDVVNLQDATRKNLCGFAEIFDRSVWLLERAEEEIIYANFAIGFGKPHTKNEFVARCFQEMKHRKSEYVDLGRAVDTFVATLQQKAHAITKLKIVTLTEEQYQGGFIEQLATRPGYEYLNEEDTKRSIIEDEKTFRSAVLGLLKARDGQRAADKMKGEKMQEEWREGNSLPVQILIAGLPGQRDTAQETRRGCVVFLLGTESVGGIRRQGVEAGFYTELPHIIGMYEDLIDNVATSFNYAYPSKPSQVMQTIQKEPTANYRGEGLTE